METLLTITIVAFAVLQIILFFKVWGMTNDVEKIKEGQTRQKGVDARIAYLRGDKEKAQMLLDEYFFEEARKFAENANYDFERNYKTHANYCSNLYANMELKAPDFEKYKNKELLIITGHKLLN